MENNIEKRELTINNVGDRTIKGTAIVFDSLSNDLGGFKEIIKRDAVTQDLIEKSDIVMNYNHNNQNVILARSKNGKGTLQLFLTDSGVDFEFSAKKTAFGDELLESVRCGDLDKCSFAFKLAKGGESWAKDNGQYIRTITKIESLHDVSIVTSPAYSETSVNTRGLDELIAIDSTINDELNNYYTELRSQVDKLFL